MALHGKKERVSVWEVAGFSAECHDVCGVGDHCSNASILSLDCIVDIRLGHFLRWR